MMSEEQPPDDDEDFPEYLPDDFPDLETEESRNEGFGLLVSEDDLPCSCSVIQVGENMVLRVRYPDNSEELFDVLVRRKAAIQLVDAPEEEEPSPEEQN